MNVPTEAAPLEALALPRPGERVGRYRVVREIGRGAMGIVFEVVHEKLERPAALKLLRPLAIQDEGAVRRFEREAKILAKLSSPNLVHVLDVDRTDAGVPYLVMELLEGKTLEARLDEGPLPLEEARAIVLDLCAGAEAAHAAGVVHRDLKPSNVMITKSGAKIVDFGVAAFTSGSMDGSTASVAGTPRTMSPEQLLGERVGPPSDVFAIGVVAYRAIAGRYPFEAESMAAQMLAIMRGHVPLADVAEVPRALSDTIDRALDRDPTTRIGSASELGRALRDTSEAPAGAAPSAPGRDPARNDVVVPERASAAGSSRVDAATERASIREASRRSPTSAGRHRGVALALGLVGLAVIALALGLRPAAPPAAPPSTATSAQTGLDFPAPSVSGGSSATTMPTPPTSAEPSAAPIPAKPAPRASAKPPASKGEPAPAPKPSENGFPSHL